MIAPALVVVVKIPTVMDTSLGLAWLDDEME
jgi:hypothetical protein